MVSVKGIISFLYLIFICNIVYSQLVVFQDFFKGGVVGSGVSVGGGAFGNYNFDIYMEPNSTIRKAYLICHRYQEPSPTTISLNGLPYLLDYSSEVTNYMIQNNFHISKSGVHLIDITNDITPNLLNYNLIINPPSPLNPETFFGVIYLLILYENPALNTVCTNLIFNNQDLENSNNKIYNINDVNPIISTFPVGFAINTDRILVSSNDGSNIYFNSSHLGLIGGEDMPLNINWGGLKVTFIIKIINSMV